MMNIAARKLETWLKAERMPKGAFANRVNVGPPTISRLLSGKLTPGLALAARIHAATDGFVTPNDWMSADERQEQSEVAA